MSGNCNNVHVLCLTVRVFVGHRYCNVSTPRQNNVMPAGEATGKAVQADVHLHTEAAVPRCNDDQCAAGELAACPKSTACKPLGGSCMPAPHNRQPGVVCGGASVGFCAAKRDPAAINATCVCNTPYAGADCSECAPGFHAVTEPAWGPDAKRCISLPSDLASLVLDAQTSRTGSSFVRPPPPALPTGSRVPSAPPSQQLAKSGLPGGFLPWLCGGAAVAALLGGVLICQCRIFRGLRRLGSLQERRSAYSRGLRSMRSLTSFRGFAHAGGQSFNRAARGLRRAESSLRRSAYVALHRMTSALGHRQHVDFAFDPDDELAEHVARRATRHSSAHMAALDGRSSRVSFVSHRGAARHAALRSDRRLSTASGHYQVLSERVAQSSSSNSVDWPKSFPVELTGGITQSRASTGAPRASLVGYELQPAWHTNAALHRGRSAPGAEMYQSSGGSSGSHSRDVHGGSSTSRQQRTSARRQSLGTQRIQRMSACAPFAMQQQQPSHTVPAASHAGEWLQMRASDDSWRHHKRSSVGTLHMQRMSVAARNLHAVSARAALDVPHCGNDTSGQVQGHHKNPGSRSASQPHPQVPLHSMCGANSSDAPFLPPVVTWSAAWVPHEQLHARAHGSESHRRQRSHSGSAMLGRSAAATSPNRERGHSVGLAHTSAGHVHHSGDGGLHHVLRLPMLPMDLTESSHGDNEEQSAGQRDV